MPGLPKPGDHLGRYLVERLIGRGGMGAVYEATDTQLNRSVAVKVVLPNLTDDDDFRRRFEREAAVLARVRSRHIVVVHEYGEQDGNLYLVTEFFPDGDLHSWLRTHGPLPRGQALTVAGQLGEALADAHAAGVVHRDVKPSNVLLWSHPDGRLIPYLCDFGIAAEGESSMTKTGAVVGSPGYMAPERHLGQPATASADLYSLGCVLWAALTGTPPYSGTDFQLMSAHINQAVPQLPPGDARDGDINALLRQMMAKDPAERPRSASSLAAHLQALATNEPESSRTILRPYDPHHETPEDATQSAPTRASGPMKVGRWRAEAGPPPTVRRRNATSLIVIVACALMLVAGVSLVGVYAATRGGGAPDPTASARTQSSPASSADRGAAAASPDDGPSASSSASGSDALTYHQCQAGDTADQGGLVVTGLVPLSGSDAALAPPIRAGIGLAVSDVVAADPTGRPAACYTFVDSGSSDDESVGAVAAQQIESDRPSVVVGPLTSPVTAALAGPLSDAQITTVTPAATLFAIAGMSPYVFRTISSGYVEADTMAQLLANDGRSQVAFLVPDDTVSPYGPKMRDAIVEHFPSEGLVCTYGCTGAEEFAPGTTEFTDEVRAAEASGADAIVVAALTSSPHILSALSSAGVDMSTVYLTDVSTLDYSEELPPGSLTGAHGLIAGVDPPQAFRDRLSAWLQGESGQQLDGYEDAAEAYDATVLAALAVARGGSADTSSVQANLAAVSGATGGRECTAYAACLTALGQGQEIRYVGPSQIGPLDSRNEPSTGHVEVYAYGDENRPLPVASLEGRE